MPAQFTIAWVMTHVAPLEYSFAVATAITAITVLPSRLDPGPPRDLWRASPDPVSHRRFSRCHLCSCPSPCGGPRRCRSSPSRNARLRGPVRGQVLRGWCGHGTLSACWSATPGSAVLGEGPAGGDSRGVRGRAARQRDLGATASPHHSSPRAPRGQCLRATWSATSCSRMEAMKRKPKLLERRTLTESVAFFATGALDVGRTDFVGWPVGDSGKPQQVFATSSGILTMLFICLLVVAAVVDRPVATRWSHRPIDGDVHTPWSRGGSFSRAAASTSWASSSFGTLGTPRTSCRSRCSRWPSSSAASRLGEGAWLIRPLPDGWPKIRTRLTAAAVAACASALVFSGLNWDSAAPQLPQGLGGQPRVRRTQRTAMPRCTTPLAPSNVIYSAYFVGDARLSQLLKPLDTAISLERPRGDDLRDGLGRPSHGGDVGRVSQNVSLGPSRAADSSSSAGRVRLHSVEARALQLGVGVTRSTTSPAQPRCYGRTRTTSPRIWSSIAASTAGSSSSRTPPAPSGSTRRPARARSA